MTRPTTSPPIVRTGSLPSATARGRRARGGRARAVRLTPPAGRRAPRNSLSARTANPSPAEYGSVSRRDVGAPHEVALLQAQRVDRPVAAGHESERPAGLERACPTARSAVLGRRVQLPPELADVRDPQRPARHVADGDAARPHVAERQVVVARRRQDVAGRGTPQPEARHRRRDVADRHGAVVGCVLRDPRQVVAAERGAGDDEEPLGAEPGDREVALDAAVRVEHRRVRDRRRRPGRRGWRTALEERGAPGPLDLDLGEARLVEEAGGRAGREVLGDDRGRPVLARPSRAGGSARGRGPRCCGTS